MLQLTSNSSEQTKNIAQVIGCNLVVGDWLGLTGDLGAGKTCFVKGLAQGLQVNSSSLVTSPTFTILHSYPGPIPLYHMDLYRLSTYAELVEIGYEELIEDMGVCVVEWFERVPGCMPRNDGLIIRFELVSEHLRRLLFDPIGTRGLELVNTLKEKAE